MTANELYFAETVLYSTLQMGGDARNIQRSWCTLFWCCIRGCELLSNSTSQKLSGQSRCGLSELKPLFVFWAVNHCCVGPIRHTAMRIYLRWWVYHYSLHVVTYWNIPVYWKLFFCTTMSVIGLIIRHHFVQMTRTCLSFHGLCYYAEAIIRSYQIYVCSTWWPHWPT